MKTIIAGLAAAAFVISIWIWGWNHRIESPTIFENINVLFSGLAFAVLIITVLMQKEELELQRNELKETRGEFEVQNNTMKRQRFENTFFNLVSIMNLNRRRADDIVGFIKFHEEFKSQLLENKVIQSLSNAVTNNELDLYLNTGMNIYDSVYTGTVRGTMNLYYKNLFAIQTYIDASELISAEEKLFYMNVFYSQMSNYEVSLTAYHLLFLRDGLLKQELSKPTDVAKKYGLTKNFDIGLQFTDVMPRLLQHNKFDLF